MHSASPIDAIQRFIGRLEVGMIPSVLDTVIYISAGEIKEIISLILKIKVPSGMREADLVRPVVEIRDFSDSTLLYEIYKFGEETVVTGIKDRVKKGNKEYVAITEDRKNIILRGNGEYSIFINNRHITNIYVKGQTKINKKTKLGKRLFKAIISHKNIEFR